MENTQTSRSLLMVICVAQFFLPFMMAGVNSILVAMGETTQASAKALSLITTFYALGLAIFQLLTGRMGDIWGRRRMFLIGVTVYVCASVTIGFLDSIAVIHVLRFVQGSGAAMFGASGLAILALIAPPGMRGQYIGLSAAATYAGIACGPTLAGIVAGVFSWPYFFWGTAAGASCIWFYMGFMVKEEWYHGKGEPFDWHGGFMYAASIAMMTIGSTYLQRQPSIGFGILFVGLCLLALYVRMELRASYPLLDIRLFSHNKVLTLSLLAALINYSASFGMLIFFSLYLQLVHGMDVTVTGLYLSLQFVVQAGTTPWASRLAARHGSSRISAIGVALCGTGLLAASFLGKGDSLLFFVGTQILLGLGMSFFAAPNTTVIFESAGSEYVGQAASLTGTMRTGGALINTTIISVTLGYFLKDAPPSVENVDAFLQSMHVDLMLFGILNLIAIGCALGRERGAKA